MLTLYGSFEGLGLPTISSDPPSLQLQAQNLAAQLLDFGKRVDAIVNDPAFQAGGLKE